MRKIFGLLAFAWMARRAGIVIVFIMAVGASVNAASIDLSTWSATTLDFTPGQGAGDWTLQSGNEAVVQNNNADPSFFLNNLIQTDYSMDGQWQVKTEGDNDFMGFVFGYQNSSNFYLFDWKQGAQYANSYGASANEGMTIKKMEGTTGDGSADLSNKEFWQNTGDYGEMTVLEQNHGSTKGWADNTVYDFHLDFNTTPGEFTIVVKDGSTTLWDVTVQDTTFTSGLFGFYNYSQASVEYAGFEQTGGVSTVPEPTTIALLGIGLVGLAGGEVRRRRKKKAVEND